MTEDDLLRKWCNRAHIVINAHYAAASVFQRRHRLLGVPTIILTTFVGTTIFATLAKEANQAVRILAGSASIVASILAGIQTFLRYDVTAEQHRHAAVDFGVLMRELEQLIAHPPKPESLIMLSLTYEPAGIR